MTFSGPQAELDAEFRILLGRHLAGPVPQRLVEDLIGAASAYTSGQIEKACRPWPWPPPGRHRLDEAKAAGRQQVDENARRTA